MSIKRTTKIGALALLLVFILTSVLSAFFIYQMKSNFTQVEALAKRYTDVQMARYELTALRANVRFLIQNNHGDNSEYADIIKENKQLAVASKGIINQWHKEAKLSVSAQKSADDITTQFSHLTDRLLVLSNESSSANINDKALTRDFEKLSQSFDNYFAITAQNNATLSQKQNRMVKLSAVSAIVSLFILLAVLYLVLRWVYQVFLPNISLLSEILKKVGVGELSFTLPKIRKGEFGELFAHVGEMQSALTSTLVMVKNETLEIKRGAAEIASGNQELSARTEEQASALQQTAASMEEIRTAVANNAENTVEANNIINQSNDIVLDGANVMKEAISSMKKIEKGAVKVGEINEVINNLASQTNILALNAAVEAAKAGDQGRGFSVVAAEVRNLAAKSAEAAREISQILKASIDDVAQGTKLVNKTGEHMQDIVSSITKVNKIMQGISLASEEQKLGIEQIAVAINQMDTVVQQNASLVDQSAYSTMTLDAKAQLLMDNVAIFQIEEALE